MAALFGALVIALFFLIIPVLGSLVGAVCGWIVGWFFGDAILGVMAAAGVKGISMWQLGATLGFVSGFFRNPSSGD